MKKIKVTYFNPYTLKKRVYKYIFTWDYNNHRWNVAISSIFGESQRTYSGDIKSFFRHAEEFKKENEYVTIKGLA